VNTLSNKLKDLAIALDMGRRIGKTTQLVGIVKKFGGILICRDRRQAYELAAAHGIRTATLDQRLEGCAGPFVLDHYATSSLLLQAAGAIDQLRQEKAEIQKELDEAQELLIELSKLSEDDDFDF
jgi:chromosome segregation ATPase